MAPPTTFVFVMVNQLITQIVFALLKNKSSFKIWPKLFQGAASKIGGKVFFSAAKNVSLIGHAIDLIRGLGNDPFWKRF